MDLSKKPLLHWIGNAGKPGAGLVFEESKHLFFPSIILLKREGVQIRFLFDYINSISYLLELLISCAWNCF